MADPTPTPAPEPPPAGDAAAAPGAAAGHTYEVRLTGRVDDLGSLRGLEDLEVTEGELRTVLLGEFSSQQELHDLLRRLRSYGLEVLEIRRLAEPPEEDR